MSHQLRYRMALGLLALVAGLVALYLHLWKAELTGPLTCTAERGCEIAMMSRWAQVRRVGDPRDLLSVAFRKHVDRHTLSRAGLARFPSGAATTVPPLDRIAQYLPQNSGGVEQAPLGRAAEPQQ